MNSLEEPAEKLAAVIVSNLYPLMGKQLAGRTTQFIAEVIRAAQPQLAPRTPACPKCGDGEIALQIMQFGQLTCGKCKFHFMIKQPIDFAQFFTAIPAQKEEE